MSTIKSSAENLTLNADGANNDIKFQSNGSEVASIDQAGTVTATTFTGAGSTPSIVDGGNATAMTIDSNERIGVGTTSPQNPLEISGNTNYLMRITQTGTNKHMFKTVGNGASMDFLADGANNYVGFNSTTSGDDIRFQTNDGNERVRILAAGGLTFNGDTAAANALDDYEEGNFTPTVNVGTISSVGSYTKIGNTVTVWFSATTFSETSSSSYITIGGLPFAGRNNMGNATCGSIMSRATDNLANQIYVESTSLTFYGNTTGGWDLLRFNDINSSQFAMYGSATYGV